MCPKFFSQSAVRQRSIHFSSDPKHVHLVLDTGKNSLSIYSNQEAYIIDDAYFNETY